MKRQSRAILECAIFYTAAVAIVDFLLSRIPVINWLALGIVFILFTAFIVGSVTGLLSTRKSASISHPATVHDDLDSLERTIERALAERQSDSLVILKERLESLVVMTNALRTGAPSAPLDSSDYDHRPKHSQLEADNTRKHAGAKTLPSTPTSNQIESLLTKVEAWLT